MKSLRTEDLTEKVCNLLCRLNLPCVLAIELGFDGFCLSFNLPCLSLALSGAHFRKLLQRGRNCFPKCPNCGEVNLEQHRSREDLLVCPLCWHKYDKKAALEGRFIRVKKKVKRPGWAHPRGY